MTYTLDTNTISYYLRGEGEVIKNLHKEIFEKGNIYAISHFSVYEIRRWLSYKPNSATRLYTAKFEALFQNTQHLAGMHIPVWEKAAEIYNDLRSRGQLIGDADIIIAAYCLVNNYTLVTRNIKDFSRIIGLQMVDWYE